jgi:type VI secretion system secreted protein VgrG
VGPVRINQDMPSFPKETLTTPMMLKFDHAPAGMKTSWAGMPFKLYADGAMIKQGMFWLSISPTVGPSGAVAV